MTETIAIKPPEENIEETQAIDPHTGETVLFNMPESAEEVLDRHEDVELLGKSFMVRRIVNKTVSSSEGAFQKKVAQLKNVFSTPKNKILEFTHHAAQYAANRKHTRLQRTHEDSLLYKHRAKVAKKYQDRADEKKTSYDSHSQVMEKRTNEALETANKLETKRLEKIKGYTDRKSEALAHKAIRRQAREEGAGIIERRKLLAEFSPEDRVHVGRIAKIVALEQRNLNHAIRQEKTKLDTEESFLRLQNELEISQQRLEEIESEKETNPVYPEMVKFAKNDIVRIQKELQKLTTKLDRMPSRQQLETNRKEQHQRHETIKTHLSEEISARFNNQEEENQEEEQNANTN